jgi:hypothetical protein
MSSKYADSTIFSLRGENYEIAVTRPSTHEYAILEELSFVRREAQAEASLAYEDWRREPRGSAYAVYRAAQDRADAAQDDLASWARRIAA